jgi:predicted nucleotidyltransferase
LSSVVIKSSDPARINQAVRSYAVRVRIEHPEVERIIWFGSWVNGIPTPGSDVDICLILSFSDKSIRDRVPDFLPVGFPVGIDVFPYTNAEFEALRLKSPSWYKAITAGREL